MTDNHKYSRNQLGMNEDSLYVVSSYIEDMTEVLDVGCYEGALGRFLISEKKCIVDGIEYEEKAAELAREYYRDVRVVDLNIGNVFDTISKKYDYIIFADVLEHLYDPSTVLKNSLACLKDKGHIIVSVPNIGYQGVLAELLNGEFQYRKTGILDKTHLRFFTRKSLKRMISESGLSTRSIRDVTLANNDSEFAKNASIANSQELNQVINKFPDTDVYQFVASCVRCEQKDYVIENLSNRIDLDRGLKYKAKLYWRKGNDSYTESQSISLYMPYTDGDTSLSFEMPNVLDFTEIRVDICEEPMCCHIYGVTVKSFKDEILNIVPLSDIFPSNQSTRMSSMGSDNYVIYSFLDDAAFSFKLNSDNFSELRFKIEVRIGNLKPVTELNDVIDDLVLANTHLMSSTSWRITAPMRYSIKLLKSAKKKVGVLVREVRSINYRLSLSLLIESIRKDGFSQTYRKVIKRCSGNTASRKLITYQDYLRYEINRNTTEVAKIAKSVEKDLKPKISIILPVYKTDLKFLKECIDSVFSQSYGEWELCICDDFSNSTEITAFLESYTTDPRFKFITNENNGHISDSSNKALQLATGRYVVLLDHDDLLHKYALHYIAGVITEHQDVDIIYTDEDHVTVDGVRKSPFFKPDWSPVLLYGQNYIGHITCISKKVIDEVGGFRLGLEGAQDYDLVLRASTKARRVVHIPRVLYHWREHPLSTAMNAESKPYAHDAGKQAVADYLRQKYPNNFVKVNDGDNLFTYEPEFSVNNIKKVSIIIPIRDRIELLIDLIQSIEKYTTWLQYEIIVIDNGSLELATSDYLNSLVEKGNCKVIRDDSKFNWSKLNNDGAKVATGDVLIFLNNDTLVITPKWIEYLVSWAVLPDVAVVGPQLLYEDGSLQHAGVVVGMSGWADHVFKGQSNIHSVGPFVSPAISRNVLALTGACHVIERQKFNLLGGYDELFEICGSDIELCIRAHKLGYSNVYLAQAKLYHLESKSRTSFVPDCDFKRSAQMYEPYRKQSCDPFYNVNLDMFNTQPSVKI